MLQSLLHTFWQAKALAEPFDYSEYIEHQKKKKLEKEFLGQRITSSMKNIQHCSENISRDAKCRSNMAVASQTTSIKGSSLLCLVNVIKSLVDWEKSCGESDKIKTLSLWKEMLQLKSLLM
ncbi:hypothetical protein RchiOBHm_Chr4g0442741 [Rosa chinensis]|uniref:Uncharacterized protein n=1 Tax=Rosa chinensis TaxID=74649 RepID=A0A2P6R3Q9_ROSCH|nr:hypothetical protein RchiOBHm_Chr4g0442741 [Rosa chinensis]